MIFSGSKSHVLDQISWPGWISPRNFPASDETCLKRRYDSYPGSSFESHQTHRYHS